MTKEKLISITFFPPDFRKHKIIFQSLVGAERIILVLVVPTMEKVQSFPDFVTYLISSFCILFSPCAGVNASNMASFSDNSFAPRECNGWHDFKYFKICSTSHINIYLGTEGRRFDMPFIRFLTRG